MKRLVAIGTVAILLAALVCSVVVSETTGEIWLGGYMLLKIRCAAGGYTIEQRVEALQARANNLLELYHEVSAVTVRMAGSDAVISTDGRLFITVTAADAKANGTTPQALAGIWAQRLRANLAHVTPEKPGVGIPGHPSGSEDRR